MNIYSLAYSECLTKRANSKEHEAICNNCGKCCYMKLRLSDDLLILTSTPCEFLDEDSKLCTVYEDRHEACPSCLNIADAIENRALPNSCPYVADLPDYKGPIDLDGITLK